MAGFFRGDSEGLRVETRHLPQHKREEILAGWVELITRYTWDVFATLTWRKESSGEVMLRNFGWWLWMWQSKTAQDRGLAWLDDKNRLHGPWANAYRKGRRRPVWIVGIEGRDDGRLHAHAMIKWDSGLEDLRRDEGWRLWFDEYGRARLEPPRCQNDVAAYCSKYVIKDGDITLSPSFQAARMADDKVRRPAFRLD